MKNEVFVLSDYSLPLKWARIGIIVLGSVMITWGISGFVFQNNLIFNNLYFILFGIFNLFLGVLVLSKNSRYSKKIAIDDGSIVLKNKIFHSGTRLNWVDIKSIELGSYRLNFTTKTGNILFKYECNTEISQKIKNSIRANANQKGIEIWGG
jgi:hypothetical protein